MDEYNILFKYGIEVGILGAFLWAFKKVLSHVLDDKTAMMEIVGQNTEAFYSLKDTMKDHCEGLKAFRAESMEAISGFQDQHKRLCERDEKMLEILKRLNGKEKKE